MTDFVLDMDAALLISTHTPLAGRDVRKKTDFGALCISTHTPLAGRDGRGVVVAVVLLDFNSHAPCGA